jgi:hypothetical protein
MAIRGWRGWRCFQTAIITWRWSRRCRLFFPDHPQVVDIFYATTPPRVVVEALATGGIVLGNLTISVKPQVFISPPKVLDALVAGGA